MELNAKPIETDMVLVHDKILIAIIGANSIKPVHMFTTGWELDGPNEIKEPYAAYKQTKKVKELIQEFEEQRVNVDLKDYMDSFSELESYFGEIVYLPIQQIGTENE